MAAPISPNSTPPDCRTDTLKGLVNRIYEKTKFWAGLGIAFQLFLYVSAIVAIFVPCLTLKYPAVALPMALASVFIGSKAAKCKSLAEKLKREHEYADGFGKPPSGPRLASLNVEFPKELRPDLNALLSDGITYDSERECGSVRALENLSESAWFSQHLSAACATVLTYSFVGSLAFSIWVLLICATDLAGTPAGQAGAQGVASTLQLLISAGLFRNLAAYRSYSQRAEQVDAEARRLLASKKPEIKEVLRLIAEYQVARAGAPLIPTWMWRAKRDDLNRQWALHKIRN